MAFPWKDIEAYIATQRDTLTMRLSEYLPSDALLYLAEDADLRLEQQNKIKPILEVLSRVFRLDLQMTETLTPLPTYLGAAKRFPSVLNGLTIQEFAAVYTASGAMRSVLLGLLLAKGLISADTAFETAESEELYQVSRWGDEPIARERRETLRTQLHEIAEYVSA